ncbi:hypothetical protein PSH25_006314, partial [Micromonospora sp. PSH25]|nr:hypothetical protein [Micromonospora foliorum]
AAATAAAGSGVDALTGRLRGSADALRRRSGDQSSNDKSGDATNDQDAKNGQDARNDQDATNDRDSTAAEQRRGR